MAAILFVYARTSIQAAKRNAQSHREADGGQISWRNESLRRHGQLEPPEKQGVLEQLLLNQKGKSNVDVNERETLGARKTLEEEIIRARAGKGGKE
jgi:hypothetical protein